MTDKAEISRFFVMFVGFRAAEYGPARRRAPCRRGRLDPRRAHGFSSAQETNKRDFCRGLQDIGEIKGMALAETRERNASVRAAADPLDTFPKLLFEHAAKRGARPAFREKDYGIWQSWSWAEAAREIEEFAAGLAALGFKRGADRPIESRAIVAAEMKFVLDHAEARFAIAENQE